MVFLAPAFLIGLLALAIPVIIHLWSKNTKESKPFGSIRFLRETETKTMRSLLPSQWLLLLTRMLLLTCLVFILADMAWKGEEEDVSVQYLVDPVYQGTEVVNVLVDTVSKESQVLWLAKGFPPVERPVGRDEDSDYWKLLSQPPSNARASVVVSPLNIANFNSSRKDFPIAYKWLQPPVSSVMGEVLSYKKGENSFSITQTSDEWRTSYDLKETSDTETLEISYYVETAENYKHYEQMFDAALETLNSLSALTLTEAGDARNADWLLWFSNDDPPGRDNLIFLTHSVAKWDEISEGVVRISNTWDEEDAIRMNLPQKLNSILAEGVEVETREDLRTMDVAAFSYSSSTSISSEESVQSRTNLLWVILLFLLISERWLAFKSERV